MTRMAYRIVCAECRCDWLAQPQPPIVGVLSEIAAERARQDGKWGGPEHDDAKTTAEFADLIQAYATWARTMDWMGSPQKTRRRLLQVAAIAAAAVESHDRKHPQQRATEEQR